jgi:hypothetical protein
MIDALAFEPQFLDHIAPVWLALPQRGTFYVDPMLMDRAARLGVSAVAQPRPPHTVTQPKPNPGYRPALVASYGDIKEGRRLGYGPFAFLEHGAGQTYDAGRTQKRGHASYSGGQDREDNELVLVPNEHAAGRWRASYPDARVVIVGCPKLDTLPRREPSTPATPSTSPWSRPRTSDAASRILPRHLDGSSSAYPTIAISFHWPAPLSISGYAGTALGDFLPALQELAAAFPGRVIGHAHPKGDWPARMKRTFARFGIPFVAEFEDVCRLADVYVCDNSSTIFEFAATGRPVVVLNARVWSRKQSHGLRFWEAANVGVNVDRPQDLVAGVYEALADAPDRQKEREAALGIVYGLRTNGAVAAATAILDWLAERVEVAA